jgi:hypothetical protein
MGGAAAIVFALCAAAYVGWLSVVDRWLEPRWRRLVGRALGVRIDRANADFGLLKTRAWAAVPADHKRAPTVVMFGALSTLTVAVCPAVALVAVVIHSALSPHWVATFTLMSVLVCPIGFAAQVLGDGTAGPPTQEARARLARGRQPPPNVH